jgi:hypothetical protein
MQNSRKRWITNALAERGLVTRMMCRCALFLAATQSFAWCACADAGDARVVPYYGYQHAIELTNSHGVRVVLCPEVGGRILEYSLDGANILYLSEQEKNWKPGQRPQASAGRFDIGPELVIPKREILWSGKWTGEIVGPRHARLTSQDDPATGVRLIRDFRLHESSTRLLCTQTIVNVSDETKEWCHWSRTFAAGNGICLIPVSTINRFPKHYVMYEDGSLLNFAADEPHIRIRDGFVDIFDTPRKPKLGFDSYEGMIAYAAPNDMLFVKRFATFSDRVYNEAAGLTISVWYPDGQMIELEPIGPRERLAPGEAASFTEEWWLAPFEFPTESRTIDLQKLRVVTQKLKSPPEFYQRFVR